jgi:hypothetical protein
MMAIVQEDENSNTSRRRGGKFEVTIEEYVTEKD